MSRKLRGRNLVLGLDIYCGGTEGNALNVDAIAALEEIKERLRAIGVRVGSLHPRAAINLRNENFWLSRIVDTSVGRANLVIVGDWRVWRGMDNLRGPFHNFHIAAYRDNGAMVYARSMELPILRWRPANWTRRKLVDQGLLMMLQGLAVTLKGPACDPGYRYDINTWPYEGTEV